MPADHAGQAAIVEPVLRPGHGVQVDEHLKPGPLRPVERTVEVFDASGMPGHVTEDEKNGTGMRTRFSPCAEMARKSSSVMYVSR